MYRIASSTTASTHDSGIKACAAHVMESMGQTAGVHPNERADVEDLRDEASSVDDLRVDAFRDKRSARCTHRASLRSSLFCNERKFCAAHCSTMACGGTSVVHSPRDIAASQNCMTMLVIGRWFAISSDTVQ